MIGLVFSILPGLCAGGIGLFIGALASELYCLRSQRRLLKIERSMLGKLIGAGDWTDKADK